MQLDWNKIFGSGCDHEMLLEGRKENSSNWVYNCMVLRAIKGVFRLLGKVSRNSISKPLYWSAILSFSRHMLFILRWIPWRWGCLRGPAWSSTTCMISQVIFPHVEIVDTRDRSLPGVVAWTGEHSSRGWAKSDQFRDSNRNRPFPGNIFLKMFVSREDHHFISYSICNAAKKTKTKKTLC